MTESTNYRPAKKIQTQKELKEQPELKDKEELELKIKQKENEIIKERHQREKYEQLIKDLEKKTMKGGQGDEL